MPFLIDVLIIQIQKTLKLKIYDILYTVAAYKMLTINYTNKKLTHNFGMAIFLHKLSCIFLIDH